MQQNQWYPIDVLVNSKPVQIYSHQNKLYVEARPETEYAIRIKNGGAGRILALSSVDGLNTLNGQSASEADSGYVIDAHDTLVIKGFRVSDEEVGAFKFTSKQNSYAAGKGTEEAAHVGVIGVRLFSEKPKPITVTEYIYVNKPIIWRDWGWPYNCGPFWGDSGEWSYSLQSSFSADNSGPVKSMDLGMNSVTCSLINPESTRRINSTQNVNSFYSAPAQEKASFDMGTDFGQAKTSKVVETTFERGALFHSLDIYYASREALIAMGVPMTNEQKVAFPQSFPAKYATPPAHWRK